jgi:Fe-S-cluster containining protein
MAVMPSEILTAEDMFECTQCGVCCKGFGGTYVSEEDIAAIAGYLSISPDTVRHRYCAPSGRRLVLGQKEDGYCLFFDRNCTIHPVKPRMCRMWPFIPSLLTDLTNWRIMAGSCPGMKQDLDEDAMRRSLPDIIKGQNGE